eukprot:TRINITY_DN5142_c0_g1_i1.p2 TRINITY_DN5142_c0_g1~~TRINITY_DN5142_c0_g1_i1.p2  ORF type:complete len:116 (-),score=6.29 TRINITY_DN5142_c0_g1_i1:415-762(-)
MCDRLSDYACMKHGIDSCSRWWCNMMLVEVLPCVQRVRHAVHVECMAWREEVAYGRCGMDGFSGFERSSPLGVSLDSAGAKAGWPWRGHGCNECVVVVCGRDAMALVLGAVGMWE